MAFHHTPLLKDDGSLLIINISFGHHFPMIELSLSHCRIIGKRRKKTVITSSLHNLTLSITTQTNVVDG